MEAERDMHPQRVKVQSKGLGLRQSCVLTRRVGDEIRSVDICMLVRFGLK